MHRQPIIRTLFPTGLALCVGTLVTSVALAASTAGDWPGFRGPNGNGQVSSALPAGDGDLQLRVAWQRDIGSGYSGIAVLGDVAVTATSDGERDLVLAFDPRTGS